MWAIRFLNSAQAGSLVKLKPGKNILGRGPHCDIRLASAGISKEHCSIQVNPGNIIFQDLGSSNGCFINGVKVKNTSLNSGDKILIHDLMFELIPNSDMLPAAFSGNAAMNLQPAPATFQAKLDQYIEDVAMPGIYKLPQILEFRYVLAGFIIVFVIVSTLLSMVPMVQITRSSIISESKRRAQSLARALANANQQAMAKGSYTSLSTHQIEIEDGVRRAMIVQQADGVILAPSSQAGNSPDLPFVVSARKELKSTVAQVDNSTIGASWPIGLFDPQTGDPIVKAHAVILYDIGSLAFDDGRVLSLFFQTLILSAIIGLFLFLFLYKLIEHPIHSLNKQIDEILRGKKESFAFPFIFPPLQRLIENFNSFIIRSQEKSSQEQINNPYFESEVQSLVQLMAYPTLAIRAEGSMWTCNEAFEKLIRVPAMQIQGQSLDSLSDGSLRKNISELILRAKENPSMLQTDQLEFSGHPCTIKCQAFFNGSQLSHFLISISPNDGGTA